MTPTPPDHTPWGKPDIIEVTAPGIVSYSTPSHGGMWLSPERMAQLPDGIVTFAGGPWFEEDCDALIVIARWPEYFCSAYQRDDIIKWCDGLIEAFPEGAGKWIMIMKDRQMGVFATENAAG